MESYLRAAERFVGEWGEPTAEALAEWRAWLEESFKLATVNQRIQALNHYLGYLGHEELRLEPVRMEKVRQTEQADYASYRRLVRFLRENEFWRDYHAVRILATTGVSVDGLVAMTVDDVRRGDVEGGQDGGRRTRIPASVAGGALSWAESEGRMAGPLFPNRYGGPITRRGLSYMLKQRALECGVDERLVHPQSLKNLLSRCVADGTVDSDLLEELLG